ncbi:MAG: ankyrin repeat domain-containing protein [Synergistaceae bacterium]|nr:ankyrin repeat domain-containing protein [Synergistaceae bacterium]
MFCSKRGAAAFCRKRGGKTGSSAEARPLRKGYVLLCVMALACLFFGCGKALAAISPETFFELCASGKPQVIEELIKSGVVDVNAKAEWKNLPTCTALMVAIGESVNPEIVSVLLQNGADVNAKGTGGFTALLVAAMKDNPDIVDLLLKAGADVNAKTEMDAEAEEAGMPPELAGKTALTLAVENNSDPKIIAMLKAASEKPGPSSGAAGLPETDKTPRKSEGDGFDSPEDAARAYLEALGDQDLPRMISTFAIESYARNYNLEAELTRSRAYFPGAAIQMPNANEFAVSINTESRRVNVARMILSQYLFLCYPDLDQIRMQPLKDVDVSEFVGQFSKNLNKPNFRTVEFVRFVLPKTIFDRYFSASNLKNLAQMADRLGAKQVTGRVAVFKLDGKEYWLCLDAVRYGDKWYLMALGGSIGIWMNIDVTNGGILANPGQNK